MVEHLIADEEVPGSTLGAPSFSPAFCPNLSQDACAGAVSWLCALSIGCELQNAIPECWGSAGVVLCENHSLSV